MTAEAYKRAIPNGSRIVLDRVDDRWFATLHAAGRTVRWQGVVPDEAVVSLARAWMAQCAAATSQTT